MQIPWIRNTGKTGLPSGQIFQFRLSLVQELAAFQIQRLRVREALLCNTKIA
jgi:hypothetical protein